MQPHRRIYLYTVAFISLEILVWGAVRLGRSVLDGGQTGEEASSLAGALSLVLVGIPVFGLHWWLAQREVSRHPEERAEWPRVLFLYGALFVTLIPVAHNILALLNRALFSLFGLDPAAALIGGGQAWGDNLAAVLINLAAAAVLFWVLRADWKAGPPGETQREARHLHADLWLVYGLGLVVFGVSRLLQFILGAGHRYGLGVAAPLGDGLALLIVGLPLWYLATQAVRQALSEPEAAADAAGLSADKRSSAAKQSGALPRLRILYTLTLICAVGVLPAVGLALYTLLRLALGVDQPPNVALAHLNRPLSLAVPLGMVWAYYARVLRAEIHRPAEPASLAAGRSLAPVSGVFATGWLARFRRTARLARALPLPGRAGLRRLYYYTLALLGLGGVFLGLFLLLSYLVETLLSGLVVWGDTLPSSLAAGLAALLVGLPVWLLSWLPVQQEAALDNEFGEHARRSVVRKGYLFFLIFLSLAGLIASALSLLFQLLTALLGDAPLQAEVELAQGLMTSVLFAVFLGYHWHVRRQDSRLAERVLTRRRSLYPVLILAPDDGNFGEQLAGALEREAAGLPIAVHYYRQGAPGETLSAARAVILPAELVTKPSEALRLWLQNFDGPRLVVPTPANGWHWVSASSRPAQSLARQTAHLVRHLAEGEDYTRPSEASGWMAVVYILAGLFALEIVAGLVYLIAAVIGVI
jgi:hypothetical protein